MALLLLLAMTLVSHAASFAVGLDRTTIRLGESARLSITFDGGLPEKDPVLPAVQYLEFHSPTSSRSFSFGGGRSVSKTTIGYTVTPIQAGDFTIPSINVRMDGKPFASNPLKLKVLPRSAQVQEEKPEAGLMFVKLIALNTNVYVGQPFRVLIKLYFVSGSVQQMPTLESDGFTFTDLQAARGREAVNGQIYQVFQFPKAVVPVKPGKRKLGPARCPFLARIPTGRSDFFGRPEYRNRQVSPLSNEVEINVLPLPAEGIPEGFNGAVGTYSMDVRVGPTNLTAGDPITLQVAFSGKGVLENVKLPLLAGWNDFKIYPPNDEIEYSDAANHVGVRRYEQIVVPEKADVPEVPAIEFSYFSPEMKKYVTLKHAPTPISVAPAASANTAPVIMVAQTNRAKKGPQLAAELLHIKPHIGTIGRGGGLPSLVLPAATFVAWLLLWLRRRKADELANDPRLRRRLATDEAEGCLLEELRKHADAGEGEQFFKTLMAVLQERLGERLDLPASGITESVVDEKMRPAAVDADLCDAVRKLFDACNQARYAPDVESGELKKLADDAGYALKSLKEVQT